MTPAFAATLGGKSPEEVTTLLHAKGIYVARRFVDGQLTYPVYVGADGEPSFNTGNSVPKALLDVEGNAVVRIEFFPEIPA